MTYYAFTVAMRALSVLALPLLAGSATAASLPPTGQVTCYNSTVTTSCANEEFPRQDAPSASGPLSYAKLDAAGNELNPAASAWACVRDNATGLIWEVKASDGGARDQGHRYAWSNTDPATNGGDAGGTTETSYCQDSLGGLACTTANYVATVNAANFCGGSNWRLPSQRELLSLVHAGALNPAIDISYLPNTLNEVFWSSTTYSRIPAFAWGVHFGNGAANADYKDRPYRVRLVRGLPF